MAVGVTKKASQMTPQKKQMYMSENYYSWILKIILIDSYSHSERAYRKLHDGWSPHL